MKRFYFLSGLPRSGSTVLSALLAQNPEIFVSVTSPLNYLLVHLADKWNSLQKDHTIPFPHHLESLSYFLIHGYYESVESQVIIDKSRAWPRYVNSLNQVLDEPPKIVCTVRDVSSILASFHRLFEWNGSEPNPVEGILMQRGWNSTPLNRSKVIWENIVQTPWEILREGIRHYPQNLHLVEYDDLLKDPQSELERIYEFLGLPSHKHDFENIETRNEEIDEKWGIPGLHAIAPKLGRRAQPPVEILGEEAHGEFQRLRLEFWRENEGLT